MKKVLLALSLSAIVCVSLAFEQSNEPKPVPKISVEYTVEEWQSKVNTLEEVKAAIKNSDLPIKFAIPLIDSISSIEKDLVSQINVKYEAQQAALKTDSLTTPKKKK